MRNPPYEFMQDIKSRLATRIQLTTDGHKPYLKAVDETFDGDIDFAQLIKIYGNAKAKETKSGIVRLNLQAPKRKSLKVGQRKNIYLLRMWNVKT